MELIQNFLDGGDWEVRVATAVQAGLAVEPLGGLPEMTGSMGTNIGYLLGEAA